MKIEALSIPETELKTILKLHQRRLGWSFLLESTIVDRQVGFPCETEELFVRRKLKEEFVKVNAWFRRMSLQNNWPSKEGHIWEVDFSSGQVFVKQQYSGTKELSQEQGNPECGLITEGPIMAIGDIDVGVIKHLLERRQALADSVRSHLRLFFDGKFSLDELQELVQQIGAASVDVNDWFSEMAKKYCWPKPKNDKWIYRVDAEEKKIFLEMRK